MPSPRSRSSPRRGGGRGLAAGGRRGRGPFRSTLEQDVTAPRAARPGQRTRTTSGRHQDRLKAGDLRCKGRWAYAPAQRAPSSSPEPVVEPSRRAGPAATCDHGATMPTARRSPAAGAASLGAGALVAAVPPAVGLVAARLRRLRHPRPPARRPAVAQPGSPGAGCSAWRWLLPGMAWMWFLTAPGYLVAVGRLRRLTSAWPAPSPRPGRWRWLGLPAAITLAEALRFRFPFGGVPLASLAIGQADGPAGAAGPHRRRAPAHAGRPSPSAWRCPPLSRRALVPRRGAGRRARRRCSLCSSPPSAPQGTPGRHAPASPSSRAAARRAPAPSTPTPASCSNATSPPPARSTERVDLVVWPENVIDVPSFVDQPRTHRGRGRGRARSARRSPSASPRTTAATASSTPRSWCCPTAARPAATTRCTGCPFGEYMPLRGLLEALGAPDRPGAARRHAGHGSGRARQPDRRRWASAISWEVFFGDRARDGVQPRRHVLLNPTNGSSYTGTILQTQQVASSRLRAIETGRWVVQVAPTGFSAFVTPGRATCSTAPAISEQAVRVRDGRPAARARRSYVHLGDCRSLLLAAAMLRRLRSCRAGSTASGAARPASTSSRTVTGPSLTSSTAMSARNRPVATRAPSRRSSSTTACDERLGLLGPGRRDPARAAAPARVAVERELADDEHLAVGVGHGAVHHARVVVEDPQAPDACSASLRASASVSVWVTPTSATRPGPDRADQLAADRHGGPRHPLHDRAHGGRP